MAYMFLTMDEQSLTLIAAKKCKFLYTRIIDGREPAPYLVPFNKFVLTDVGNVIACNAVQILYDKSNQENIDEKVAEDINQEGIDRELSDNMNWLNSIYPDVRKEAVPFLKEIRNQIGLSIKDGGIDELCYEETEQAEEMRASYEGSVQSVCDIIDVRRYVANLFLLELYNLL